MKLYDNVPQELQPLSPWKYFWLSVLYSIPVIGLICLIIHSISSANINRKNFALSHFCILVLIAIVIGVILLISGGTAGISSLLSKFNS